MRLTLWALTLLLLGSLGCQHASPTSLQTAPERVVPPKTVGLGAWDLILNADTLSAELTPARTGATLGDTLLLDASPYFTAAFRIDGVHKLPNGHLALDVTIKHPLPLPDPDNPKPSDRLDLHLTDVLGVVVLETTQSARPYVLTNAAGYTTALSSSLVQGFATSAWQHPYVLLSLDTRQPNFHPEATSGWVDLRAPQGLNVLPMGSSEKTSTFEFDLPAGTHRIRLAIQASMQQAGQAPASRMNPIYAYPEGSQQAPWAVVPSVHSNGLAGGSNTGSAQLRIDIYDWQAGAIEHTGDDWTPALHKGEVRAPVGINMIDFACLALEEDSMPGPLQPVEWDGVPGHRMSYELTVRNTLGFPAGTYEGIVAVSDRRPTHEALSRSGDLFTTQENNTWQYFKITIPERTGTYITHISCAPSDELFVESGAIAPLPVTVHFSDGTSESWSGPVTYSLIAGDPTDVVLSLGGSVQRLTPWDESSTVVVRAAIDHPDVGLFVADTTILLGDPWADSVPHYYPQCGASTGAGINSELTLGGPRGAGENGGSVHTASLGYGGSITLRFDDGGVVDQPGPDFIVFENAFNIGQDPTQVFTETVKVEVKGETGSWQDFPMDYRDTGPTPWRNPDNFTGLAGVHPVLANVDDNAIDPLNPATAGGDAFDLATIGVPYAKYIRLTSTGIDDTSPCYAGCGVNSRLTDQDGDPIDDTGKHETCSGTVGGPDIDAIAIVRGHQGSAP